MAKTEGYVRVWRRDSETIEEGNFLAEEPQVISLLRSLILTRIDSGL